MTEPSTRPEQIDSLSGKLTPPWQREDPAWSFGPIEPRIVWPERTPNEVIQQQSNRVGDSTVNPQKITGPEDQPRHLRGTYFGKRSLEPLSHWEGVVEAVKGDIFQARLVPLVEGRPDPGRVEFTDFSTDDLADESDRSLVVPNAVFYWTIGRARNSAGTVTNVSLVRFRRLPPPTRYLLERAEREAKELLNTLGGDDESDPAEG
jgi:hypothetical protein